MYGSGIWENFTKGIIDYGMSAYDVLGIWKYPMLFVGIIGYLYAMTESATVAIVGIIITFALYGGTSIFVDVPDLTLFFYIITIMGIALLITTLFLKKGRYD